MKRPTIGLLAENNWIRNENINSLFQGIFEACEKHDANLIRFGFTNANELLKVESQHEVILDLIKEFELDGLIFVGWSIAVQGDNLQKLRDKVQVPMYSIGKKLDDIPSNFMHGGYYLREMIRHLITEHGYRRIAYVCPWSQDGRNEVYKRTLSMKGIYDPAYYISESELKGLNMYERAKRAVSILLDERRVSPEVIIAMTMEEAYTVQLLLQARGYKIPEDISVCSYEDGAQLRYASPSITSIYFPTRELASLGTEKLLNGIRGEQIPAISSVSGRIEYRESCGCKPQKSVEEFELSSCR